MKDIYGFDMQHIRIHGESFCSIEDSNGRVRARSSPLPPCLGTLIDSDFEVELMRVREFFRQL